MREYGLDLRDEYETAGVRRLWALIKGLPPNSATWGGESRWTQDTEFLAELLELTDIASHRTVAALGGKMKAKPIEIKRPYGEIDEPPKPKPKMETDTQAIARFFALTGG